MDFHNQGKKTSEAAMKAWRKEAKAFSAKYEYGDDYLIEKRDEIESLLDRGQTFSIEHHKSVSPFDWKALERLRKSGIAGSWRVCS